MIEVRQIFAVVPVQALLDKRLTLEQLRVLCALYSFKPKDSDIVYPRREAIAERCGIHTANISSTTSALERFGWLTKEGKGGHSRATRYTLGVPETVARSATVADQATVAEGATPTVADPATRMPLAESATRKELTNRTNQMNKPNTADDEFASFWQQYPKKVAKPKAMNAWRKIKPAGKTLADLMAGLERQRASEQWQKDGGQFIPNPASWLNGRRWDDEVAEPRQYKADELEVIGKYNSVLHEAGWPEGATLPFSAERASLIREFIRFNDRQGWIDNYFAWIRDHLEVREGFGLDWVIASSTYLRAREGNFSTLRKEAA